MGERTRREVEGRGKKSESQESEGQGEGIGEYPASYGNFSRTLNCC